MATEARSLHAWFSASSAETNGFAVYLSNLDQEVFVTEVREASTPYAKWPDAKYVGRVHTFLRRHRLRVAS